MTDLNPEVLQELADQKRVEMAKAVEGMDIRDCDLIGAIHSVAHESNKLEGELACIVLFHGSEEEWFEEREALLRNYEQNSIETLKEMLRVDGLSMTITRTDPNVTLHDQLVSIKELCASRGLTKYIVYLAQKTPAQLDSVVMSNVFHGQKFDWTFAPSKEPGVTDFNLSLLAAPQGGAKPINYRYAVVDVVPTVETHAATPEKIYVDIPGHQKVFEIQNADESDYLVAYDLLQMFLTETGQLAANNDDKLVIYLHKTTVTRPVGYNETGERLFHSSRFQGLLPRVPAATVYTGTVDGAITLYGDLLIYEKDPRTEVLFISTSMQGEEFVNVREELDQLLATETPHQIGLMFHSFVPGTIDREGLFGYIREALNPERNNVVYISENFKYKEAEGVQ